MNRVVLVIVLILALLISTLAASLLVQVVTANPFMPSGSWSDEPIPPSIEVQSPNQTEHYLGGSDVWLNFTVTKPVTNWYDDQSFRYPDYYASTFGNLTKVYFSVDGQQTKAANSFFESALKKYALYVPSGGILHYSVNLGHLTAGTHFVEITAEGSAYWGNLTHSAFSDCFVIYTDHTDIIKPVSSSLQVNFVVVVSSPSATLLPSENPSASPSALSQSIPSQEPFPAVLVAAVSAAIATVAVAGLTVYLKKRKH